MYTLESDDRILLRLERGQEIVSSLERFVGERNIPNAVLLGIGAIEDVELGAYRLATKEYVRRPFPGHYELVNMTANVGYADQTPVLHAHVTISDEECNCWAGHLFRATVHATVEIVLWPGQSRLLRSMNDEIGLKLWDLPNVIGPSPF